jgi:Flp pilus assembly protein TadG
MVRKEKGQVIIFVALFMTIFLGVAALAVDVGRVYIFQAQLQNALDAGVLAGAWQLPEDQNLAKQEAIRLIQANGFQITNQDIEIIDEKIRIKVSREIETVFAKVLGISKVNVTAQSAALSIPYPLSHVFDYVYFLNNWGWFYGSGITANGDIRSNGDFDFKYDPFVFGDVYASGDIRGSWQTPPGQPSNVYEGVEKLDMPNLQSLDYYEQLAYERNSYVKIGDELVIDRVFEGNIILEGSPSKPIEIKGPVVIKGDVIIKGIIEGAGTIYAGRNIYIADDITYKNAPSSPRPASKDPEVIDGWVEANKDKDIIGLAARENVIIGDYTSNDWYADWWLFDMGSEDVGADGIPDTNVWIDDPEHPDGGYWTDPTENDGIFQQHTEDLDGDGEFDDNYSWQDVQTQVHITEFNRLPQEIDEFSDIATNYINKIECIIYTNHACTGRLGYGIKFNGAIISKDEALIYRNTITLNYDERIHSRYRKDPNWLIDLRLPVGSREVKLIPY